MSGRTATFTPTAPHPTRQCRPRSATVPLMKLPFPKTRARKTRGCGARSAPRMLALAGRVGRLAPVPRVCVRHSRAPRHVFRRAITLRIILNRPLGILCGRWHCAWLRSASSTPCRLPKHFMTLTADLDGSRPAPIDEMTSVCAQSPKTQLIVRIKVKFPASRDLLPRPTIP
jgi:hypothetical protein